MAEHGHFTTVTGASHLAPPLLVHQHEELDSCPVGERTQSCPLAGVARADLQVVLVLHRPGHPLVRPRGAGSARQVAVEHGGHVRPADEHVGFKPGGHSTLHKAPACILSSCTYITVRHRLEFLSFEIKLE